MATDPYAHLSDDELDQLEKELTQKKQQMLEEQKVAPVVAFKNPSVEKEYSQVYGPLRDLTESAPVPIVVTSGKRSVEQNAAVGGVPSSYHITGEAIDVRKGKNYQQVKEFYKKNGYKPIDEGNHLHVEPSSRSRKSIVKQASQNGGMIDTTDPYAHLSDDELDQLEKELTQKKQQLMSPVPPESLQDASVSTQRNPYIRQLAEGRLKERNESDYLGRPIPADQLNGQLDEGTIQNSMAHMRANRMDRAPIENANQHWYSPIEDRQLSDEELRAKVVQDSQKGEENRKDIGNLLHGIGDFKAPWVGEDDPAKSMLARGVGTMETLFPTTSHNPDESLPFNQRRDQNREIEQEVRNLRKEQSPNAHSAGRMAGDVIAYNSIMKLLGGVGLGPAAAGEAGAVGGSAGAGAKKGVELMKAVLRGGTAGAGVGQLSGSEAKDAPMDAALGAGFEAILPALGIVLPWAGQKMRDVAPSIVNKMLNVPIKDLVAGKNLGKEVVERGIVGTERGLAKRAASKLNENDELLQGLLEKASIPKKPGIDVTSGIVEDIAASPNQLDNKFIVEELRKNKGQFQGQPNRAGEFKRVERMIEQYAKETPLTFAEANEVKRGIYRRNANAYSRDINPVKTEIDTSVARGIKKGIEAKIPEAKKINEELSFYGRLSDALEKKAAKAEKGGGGVNLKDLVGSTAAGAILGPQAGGAAFLASLLRENPLVATIMAQVANKGGKGLQWLGKGGSFGDALVEAVPPILINRRNQ